MANDALMHPKLGERVAMACEATVLTIRALRRYRLGLMVPMLLVLLAMTLAGHFARLISPRAMLARRAEVAPFVYPLF